MVAAKRLKVSAESFPFDYTTISAVPNIYVGNETELKDVLGDYKHLMLLL